jgi:N-acetylmuramoyl-L-alanine amidase
MRRLTLPRPLHRGRAARPPAVIAVSLVLALAATAAAPAVIRVRRGDTLWELAREHGTSVQALQELNGLRGSLIYEGQRLRLFGSPAATPKSRTGTPRTRVVETVHVVRPGESLIKISRRYGVEPAAVARRNALPTSLVVRIGQRLVIARTVAAPAPAAPSTSASRSRPGERVDRKAVRVMLVREARRLGVDPNLVVALAWQESGLQQHVVSSTGALGVMQVMPGTGEWVSRYLAKRRLDLRKVEDNIHAGVLYLRQLLRIANSESMALAGYYQGLASVRKRGMYTDTQRYVKNILALRARLARS